MMPLLGAAEISQVLFSWSEFRGLEFVLALDIHWLLRLQSEINWQFNSLCFFFFFTFLKIHFIYLFLAALGLHCCSRAFSSCSKQGLLFLAARGLLISVASLVEEHRLQARGLSSCGARAQLLMACGIFPDQGSNPCPLHWQMDS